MNKRAYKISSAVLTAAASVTLTILVLLSLSSCTSIAENNEAPDSTSAKHRYLSITYDTNDTNDSTVSGTGKLMNFYTYELDTKELVNRAQIPFRSQYALGAVSLQNNKVYYTRREINDVGNPDRLYEYDLATKEAKQLESENRTYNDIVPIGGKLLVSAIKRGTNPAVFDLDTGKFSYLYEKNGYGDDKYFTSPPIPFGYNVNTKKFLYVYVDREQHYKPSYRKGEPNGKTPIPHNITLMDIDFNNQETYTFQSEEVQFATQISEEKIICTTTEHAFTSGKKRAYLLDIKKQELKELTSLPMPKMMHVYNCFTLDEGKTFYVAGRHEDKRSGVFLYDTETDNVEPILLDDAKTGGHFINFTMLEYETN